MKNWTKHISVFIFTLVLLMQANVSYGSENDLNNLFKKGVSQYENGNFHESIIHFQQIIDNGYANFETYYNLANALYKINQLPEAIFNYEKALQYKPGNEDVLHNLTLSQTRMFGSQQSIPEHFIIRFLDSGMKTFSPRTWGVVIIILLIFTLSSFLLFLVSQQIGLKKTLFTISIFSMLLFVFSIVLSNRLYQSLKHPTHAIVMTASVGVKSAPDIGSADIYVVQAGMKVKILSDLNDWKEIRVPDGNKGWVHKSSLKEL